MALRLLAVCAALGLGLVACGVESDDDEFVDSSSDELKDQYRLKVIEHNIAGGMVHKGDAKGLDGVDGEIADFHPDVVLLSEVCESQYNAFKQRHAGWDVHWR